MKFTVEIFDERFSGCEGKPEVAYNPSAGIRLTLASGERNLSVVFNERDDKEKIAVKLEQLAGYVRQDSMFMTENEAISIGGVTYRLPVDVDKLKDQFKDDRFMMNCYNAGRGSGGDAFTEIIRLCPYDSQRELFQLRDEWLSKNQRHLPVLGV